MTEAEKQKKAYEQLPIDVLYESLRFLKETNNIEPKTTKMQKEVLEELILEKPIKESVKLYHELAEKNKREAPRYRQDYLRDMTAK